MATVAPPADRISFTCFAIEAADLLKNLSLEAQSKTLEGSEPANKPSVDSEVNGIGQSQPLDRSLTPVIPDFMDPTVAYFPSAYASPAYYYGGYDGATNDYSRFLNPDGVDMSQGVYGENGSLMYPGYGYAPYGPYSPAGSPVPTTSHDGQLYGTQHYQYPSPYFQPMTQTNAPPKGDFTRSAAAGQPSFTVDTAASVKGNTGAASVRPVANQNPVINSNGSYGSGSQNGFQDPIYRFDGVHSPIPWLDSTIYSNAQPRSNTSSVPLSNTNGFASKNQNIGSHSHLVSPRPMSAINTASGYMNRVYPNKLYGQYQGAYGSGFGFGSNSYGSQNRQGWLALDNKYKPRGRGNGFFNYNNENSDGLNELNRGPRARVTKNQKVNTSGQFVGVAEMVGPVDFNKSLDYWQQDKWVGYFPVKWHIVKDVPNSMLKHIILEYNENKPVTNSRDTQEVKLEQGLQMIKIFKDHSSKQCILDDFEFYEERQKRIQEKKAKQQLQKQAWEEKPTLVEKNKEEAPTPDLVKEEVKHTDNGSFDKAI
ncbi:hypothetical protein M8C21_008589 [Ambrosia artemisiifolia]|uniref:YTH domain-containing family protein n=1 Tax=Ambrosia artemisiifolia TaxID=4212 RepID=A0AAD5BMT4_AMBAR|nr:hypothetical protein M8C21_008589 [Ambrosia artemisiifolia]